MTAYSEIIPGLFVGSIASVKHGLPPGVKRVVNCAQEIGNIANVPAGSYLHLDLLDDDTDTDNLKFCRYISVVIKFIDSIPLQQSPVLLHCYEGISRSASMCLAYLMWHHHPQCNTIYNGVNFIVSKRQIAFYQCGADNTPMTYWRALYDTFG